jgi:hypothetical protein
MMRAASVIFDGTAFWQASDPSPVGDLNASNNE